MCHSEVFRLALKPASGWNASSSYEEVVNHIMTSVSQKLNLNEWTFVSFGPFSQLADWHGSSIGMLFDEMKQKGEKKEMEILCSLNFVIDPQSESDVPFLENLIAHIKAEFSFVVDTNDT